MAPKSRERSLRTMQYTYFPPSTAATRLVSAEPRVTSVIRELGKGAGEACFSHAKIARGPRSEIPVLLIPLLSCEGRVRRAPACAAPQATARFAATRPRAHSAP